MTPEEKARELFDKYLDIDGFGYYRGKDSFLYWSTSVIGKQARQCALIAVNEVLWGIIKYADDSKEYVTENAKFWQEVKQEIEKL
jgi:hypothetical protein